MKITTYNVMSGGFASYDSAAAQPERLSELQAVIRELDADVIGLIDTFRWDTTFTDRQLKDLFGYDYVARTNLHDARLEASGGESVGLTLLSKRQWKDCQAVRLASRDALQATFDLSGIEVKVYLAYFDDLSEAVRLRQAAALLDHMGKADGIVMGDLNTFAPADILSASLGLQHFYNYNPAMEAGLSPITAEMQKGKVISLFEKHGFQDEGAAAGPTIPTGLFPGASDRPFLRVDYCLSRGFSDRVSDVAVLNSPQAHKASDHLPLSFTVKERL